MPTLSQYLMGRIWKETSRAFSGSFVLREILIIYMVKPRLLL